MEKVHRLTAGQLKQLVQEENSKLKTAEEAGKEAKDLKPGREADTLAKHVDMLKALKIEESRLKERLAAIQEKKESLLKILSK